MGMPTRNTARRASDMQGTHECNNHGSIACVPLRLMKERLPATAVPRPVVRPRLPMTLRGTVLPAMFWPPRHEPRGS
eukprot:10267231-Alexandrium_andersonii.AAC.1